MKKTMIITIAFAMMMTLTACGSNDSLNLKETKYTVEYGKQVSTNAETYLAKDTKKEILKNTNIVFNKNKDYTVDKKKNVLKPTNGTYLPVGQYKATATYKEESKKFTVEIKDTIAPKFVDFKKEVTIEQGSKTDLTSYFKAEDLSKVTISIAGKFDANVIGTYNLKVTAKDEYKNKVTKPVTLKVVTKEIAEKEGVSTPADNENKQSTTNQPSTPQSNTQASGGSSGNSNGSGGTYVPPNNNTGNTGNTGGNGNSGGTTTPTPPPSNVCVPNGTYYPLGNSGRWFSSEAAADEWAWKQLESDGEWWLQGYHGYHAWTLWDSCYESRDDLWTIEFY